MKTEAIRFRDRTTGEILAEPVVAEGALRFLYGRWVGRCLVWALLKRRFVSRFYGWLQNRPASRRKIPAFVARLGIDAHEAERPLTEYTSLNDFFTRRLRPERRPINTNPNVLISPADGRTLVFPAINIEAPLCIKNSRVTIAELVDDASVAQRYGGGTAVVIRLAPADYHRFHFPESGVASVAREVGCDLHSVHTIALLGGAPCFLNRRMISFLDTTAFGRLALIEVGAMLVGGIRQTYIPGPVNRGDEKGYFCFGASTVILLMEPRRIAMDEDLLVTSAEGLETLVRMGARIGRRADGG